MSALLNTALPFPVRRGKVREVYEVDADHLLLVATIFSDDPSAPAFSEARRLVQSLTLLVPQKPV